MDEFKSHRYRHEDIAINRGVDHVEVTFTPLHGIPSGVVWFVATLVDGIAISGDGFDYGDVNEAIATVFYDSDRVDASSITAPNPLGVVRGTTVAVFLTWKREGGEMLAIGADGSLGEAGFELHEVSDTAPALAFLARSGMRIDPEASAAAVPESSPEAGSRLR